jgi:hypothetical protein
MRPISAGSFSKNTEPPAGDHIRRIPTFNSAGGVTTGNVAAPSQYEVPLTSFRGTSPDYINPYNGSHQYWFATWHDGQLYFTATNGGDNPTTSNPEAQYYAPMQQLASDLANNTVARFNFITPDEYNDMHTPLPVDFTYNGVTYQPGSNSVAAQEQIALGDNFLSIVVPEIMASQAYKNNGLIVIWNEETQAFHVGTTEGYYGTEVIISPLAKGNAYSSHVYYTHSSDLRTLQEIFGLGPSYLGGAAHAYDLRDLFQPGVIPRAFPRM